MKAIIWTDVLQALVMFIGLFAGLIQGCLEELKRKRNEFCFRIN